MVLWIFKSACSQKFTQIPPALHIEIYMLPPPLGYEFTWCPPLVFQPPFSDNYCTVPRMDWFNEAIASSNFSFLVFLQQGTRPVESTILHYYAARSSLHAFVSFGYDFSNFLYFTITKHYYCFNTLRRKSIYDLKNFPGVSHKRKESRGWTIFVMLLFLFVKNVRWLNSHLMIGLLPKIYSYVRVPLYVLPVW